MVKNCKSGTAQRESVRLGPRPGLGLVHLFTSVVGFLGLKLPGRAVAVHHAVVLLQAEADVLG